MLQDKFIEESFLLYNSTLERKKIMEGENIDHVVEHKKNRNSLYIGFIDYPHCVEHRGSITWPSKAEDAIPKLLLPMLSSVRVVFFNKD